MFYIYSIGYDELTFLPPEDARSAFTDSAFSLLEDLDLLLFSFSGDTGESQEGLVLWLFLDESEKKTIQPSCLHFDASGSDS